MFSPVGSSSGEDDGSPGEESEPDAKDSGDGEASSLRGKVGEFAGEHFRIVDLRFGGGDVVSGQRERNEVEIVSIASHLWQLGLMCLMG